jgi:hypothetical protein
MLEPKRLFVMLMVLLMPVSGVADTSVVLDGNNTKSGNVNGLTFKGFGVLSANGTSALLMDYKSEHPERYAELLKILFGSTQLGSGPIARALRAQLKGLYTTASRS